MTSKATFIFLTGLLVPLLACAQTVQDTLTKRESDASRYLVGPQADGARYMAMASPDYLLIDPTGAIYTAEQSLATFNTCKFDSYHIKNINVRSLSPESAIAVMQVSLDGTCAGQKVPPNYVMVDAWVKRSSKWFIQLHTETVVVSQN